MLREGDRTADEDRRSGCPESDEVAAFVERRLSQPAQAAFEAHIAACTPCRELVSALCRAESTIGDTRSGSVVTLIAEAPAHTGGPLASGTLDASLSAGAVIDRYTVLRRIGAGGMGVVYAAFDPELDRKVAIKILRAQGGGDIRRAELEARLVTEARAMAQLAHPNVVAVFEIGRFCDQVFLVMELVEGQTLRTWLAERPRGWRKIVEVFTAAGQGLAAAHAAGLVHRDFKPANVLVGRDGRARVTDFGLVQDGAANGRSAIAGTPYYMAPEQFRGDVADERTDQFSFCVALFAALYGVRPFAGDSFDALAANVCAGRLSEPRAPHVPRRIRAALRRGLSVDPAERFSSLHDLLAELAEPSHRGRWVIGVGAAVGVLVWLGLRSPAEVPDQRCTGAALAFATAWNAERRGAVEAAFTATRVPYAAVALHNVTDALDRYAAGWKQAHTEACRATRVLGEQTEATLDLRMLCLERKRQEAAALISALAGADADVVARSVVAAEGLVAVRACADVATLRQIVVPQGEASGKVASLGPRLADARAKYELGAYPRALELVRSIAAEARALAYRPFEAEADYLQGQVQTAMGDMNGAETSLNAAAWAAEAGRHDEVAARVWVWLVFLVGYHRAEYERGLAFVPRATAAIARVGGNAETESNLERGLGAVDAASGKLESSITHLQRAVALAEQAFGREHPRVAVALLALGSAMANLGRVDRALPILERGRELQERLLGPQHPRTAEALTIVGAVRNESGASAAAEQALRRALAIREAVFGPQHRDVATTLMFLAESLDAQGRNDEALAISRRAVAIAEQAFGPEHPGTADVRVSLGNLLAHASRYAEAREQIGRGEATLTKVNGPTDYQVMIALVARGDLLLWQARWREALALYERAIPVFETMHSTSKEHVRAIVHREIALIELHQPAGGLAALEQLTRQLEMRPDLRVAVYATLACALWETGDRKRAEELAIRARARIAGVGAHRHEIAQIAGWLVGHHSCPKLAVSETTP